METTQANSLCNSNNLYLKPAKMLFLFLSSVFSSTKLEDKRTRTGSAKGGWGHQWEVEKKG
jgi:hypothetical protein